MTPFVTALLKTNRSTGRFTFPVELEHGTDFEL
jgi:hypothetical protein